MGDFDRPAPRFGGGRWRLAGDGRDGAGDGGAGPPQHLLQRDGVLQLLPEAGPYQGLFKRLGVPPLGEGGPGYPLLGGTGAGVPEDPTPTLRPLRGSKIIIKKNSGLDAGLGGAPEGEPAGGRPGPGHGSQGCEPTPWAARNGRKWPTGRRRLWKTFEKMAPLWPPLAR